MNELHTCLARSEHTFGSAGSRLRAVSLICALIAVAGACQGQAISGTEEDLHRAEAAASYSSSLPDAPSATARAESHAAFTGGGQHQVLKPAGPFDKYILPGQSAPKITAYDKVLLGLRDSVSPFSAVGWVAATGYEQVTNGSPNYGQTGKGFMQRLGASAARDSSEEIFSDSVLAPILHEDPRYYKMGSGHNFFKRLVYAGTRPLITRTDGGRSTPNFSLIGGDLAGAALTQAYYPPLNRGFTEVAKTWGGSIGSSALGFVVSEFLSDALAVFHAQSRD